MQVRYLQMLLISYHIQVSSILFLAIIVAEVSRILDKVSIAIEHFRYSTGYLMIHSCIDCVQSKRWLLVFYRGRPGKPPFYLKIAYAVL